MSVDTVIKEMTAAIQLDASVGRAGLERWVFMLDQHQRIEAQRWLSEDRAIRRSRKRAGWFRLRRTRWRDDGYARQVAGKWEYHEAVVPRSRKAEGSDDAAEQARRDAAA